MGICKCKGKTRGNFTTCGTCYKRIWRKNNPEKAVYRSLVDNARRRGLRVYFTAEEFIEWLKVEAPTYMKNRGRNKHSETLDRKNNKFGYYLWNMQILKHVENDKKGFLEGKNMWKPMDIESF